MKKYVSLSIAILFASLTVMAQDSKPVENEKFITFEKTVHDFGQLTTTDEAIYEFKFVNTSGKTLLLNPPKATCGCTTPFYPKEPIEVGEENVIKVKYSTKRKGKFNKQIRVTAQGYEDTIVLAVKGEVLPIEAVKATPSKKSNSLFKK